MAIPRKLGAVGTSCLLHSSIWLGFGRETWLSVDWQWRADWPGTELEHALLLQARNVQDQPSLPPPMLQECGVCGLGGLVWHAMQGTRRLSPAALPCRVI